MNGDEYCDRLLAVWKADMVPPVRTWQSDVRLSGDDAGVVDLDLVDEDDPYRLVFLFHLRCGLSRRFVLDLQVH